MAQIFFPAQKKYLESFRKKGDDLIVEMEQYATEHKVPILDWHSADFIEKLILINKPERVLEIGTAIAYTSGILTLFCKTLNNPLTYFPVKDKSSNSLNFSFELQASRTGIRSSFLFNDLPENFSTSSRKFWGSLFISTF